MSTFASPFNYPEEKPEWLREKEREKKRNRLGKEIGTWGGRRRGAGRPPRKKPEGDEVIVKLNNIQRLSLQEMGDGDISRGIQALVDKYL